MTTMRQVLRQISLAAVGGFLAIQAIWAVFTPAQADVVPFALRGTFADGGTFSGILAIDTKAGVATNINLFADGFWMKEIVTQPSEDNDFTLVASSADGKAQAFLGLFGDLIGYSGGGFSPDSRVDNLAADPVTHTFLLAGANIQPFSGTAPAPSVPEPPTWALMIVGFAGVGFFAARRAGKVTAATTA
jgi:hypothetical protein